tara:strand:- start:555 stop:764 length:210 start_codon:yes stop_codon:yes gene_type:complete
MALSNQTISNLADALVPEVIDYIYQDERWCEFMQQVVPDALKEKLGEIDEELQFDLAMCIMDRICLKKG